MLENYEVERHHGTCKDCGFYNDCPLNYKCPPLEILSNILEHEGIYISAFGIISTLRERNDYDMDDDDTGNGVEQA